MIIPDRRELNVYAIALTGKLNDIGCISWNAGKPRSKLKMNVLLL